MITRVEVEVSVIDNLVTVPEGAEMTDIKLDIDHVLGRRVLVATYRSPDKKIKAEEE